MQLGFCEAEFIKRLGIGAAALVSLISPVHATTLYSINWLSDPQPCAPVMELIPHGPIVSKRYSVCRYPEFIDKPMSICPNQGVGQPWDNGQNILIVGYHLSVLLSSPDAKAIVELGTASDYRSADVFATASGTGTFTSKEWFPPGLGVPTGGGRARIDVYAGCNGPGTLAVLATIFYTVPQKQNVNGDR